MLESNLNEREKKIADGLAAGEKGQRQLVQAKEQSQQLISDAREQGHAIIAKAKEQAQQILDAARHKAKQESKDIVASGTAQVEHIAHKAKGELREKVALLSVMAAEKILKRSVNLDDHKNMIEDLTREKFS